MPYKNDLKMMDFRQRTKRGIVTPSQICNNAMRYRADSNEFKSVLDTFQVSPQVSIFHSAEHGIIFDGVEAEWTHPAPTQPW